MIGWLDCSSGVSGDMLLGALVGSGVPIEVLDTAIQAVTPEPIRVRAEAVTRGGLAATLVHVEVADTTTRRTWSDVRRVLEAADLPSAVRTPALSCFAALARAEATVHGTTPDEVHFHEVGALDAIADVVGVCAGLAHLGLDSLTCSTVSLGGGFVSVGHGRLPVPPPAVVELLRGLPSVGGPVEAELATPTGAALVATHATGFGSQPAMLVDAVGVGAGGRDLDGSANVVRLLLGRTVAGAAPSPALVLEANVDDLDPRLWPWVLELLLAAGASDAWLTPILMKKGRPAHTLSVLVAAHCRTAVLDVVFAETTTIGLRSYEVNKLALERTERTVEIDGHVLRVKLASYAGKIVNAQPEYDDVAAVAQATGRPLKSVLTQAGALARLLG